MSVKSVLCADKHGVFVKSSLCRAFDSICANCICTNRKNLFILVDRDGIDWFGD